MVFTATRLDTRGEDQTGKEDASSQRTGMEVIPTKFELKLEISSFDWLG